MIHISLFSGIGGFDLAAEWVGWTNGASCEIAEFPRKVLQYHFPNAYHHDDIHTLTYEKLNYELTKRFGENWRTNGIILTGGFPCQPYSTAGKRQGKNDARHLWPEMLRIIRELKPTWVVGENVYGLISWSEGLVFDEVHTDLEAEGFEVQAVVLPAAGVNAPHRRDRVWFIAHSNECRSEKSILQHSDLSTGSVRNNEQVIVNSNNKRRSEELGKIQSENGEISERNNDAEFGNTGDGLASNTESNRNRRELRGLENEDDKFRQSKEYWKDNLQLRNDGEIGLASNTTSDRRKWTREGFETEEGLQQKSGAAGELEGGFEGLCSEGITSDTDSECSSSRGEGEKTQRIRGRNNGEQEIGSEPAERVDRFSGFQQPSPDPYSERHEECDTSSITTQQRWQYSEKYSASAAGHWENFPSTEPTIRRGDDGISKLLDGITFSKWRNESIKAYGNAIVPQVAYQIFKSIVEWEHLYGDK